MLDVVDLSVRFLSRPDKYAVDGVSFHMEDGEILGLVGESGSGKSVTAMAISGLLPRRKTECSGSILLDGQEMLNADREAVRRIHTRMTAAERRSAALAAMAEAELPDPESVYLKYPHELSGGMLQRVMIAAAIVSEPKLLLADEPTTALDVTIQAQILELLKKINREKGTSILFISHNLNVVRKLCGRVAVMYKGRIVETGSAEHVFHAPQDPYTKRLIAAIPTRDKRLR